MTTTAKTSNKQSKDSIRMPPTPTQARMTFFILLIINVLNYADRSVLSSVQTTIAKEFGLRDIELGLLTSSFLLVYGLAALPLGIVADKSVRKNIVAVCVAVWSCATAIGGLTTNFIQLFLSRSVLGIGEAGYAPASASLIGDLFPKSQRGRMLSIWSASNLIGIALGMVVGGLVAQYFGWRWVFYIVGLPGLLVAFVIWRAVEPKRGAFDYDDAGNSETSTNDVSTGHGSLGTDLFHVAKQLAHTPTYWVLVAAFICSFFIMGAALAWMPTYFQRCFQLNEGTAGALSGGVLASSSLVGTLVGGWLADFLQTRMPQGRMLVSTIAFLVGAPLTWLALSMSELPYFIAIFAVAIICLSMCLGPMQAITQDITPPNIRSTAIGLAMLAGHLLGDTSSPLLVGMFSDHFQSLGGNQSQSLGLALTVTAPTSLFLAGLACLVGLKTVAKDMQKMQGHLHKK